MFTVGYHGWHRDEPGFTAYAATLSEGDDFWTKLRTADDGGDRFFYRALVIAVQALGLTQWFKKRGNDTVLRSYNQGQVGSCVGNGKAKEKSYRAALDVYMDGQAEKFPGVFCAEWEYYASRKEGGMLRSGEGSTGYGAAQASTKDGALPYGLLAGVDAYTEDRCRSWGRGSIPGDAVKLALPHVHKEYVKVDTAEKVWLAAGFGFPMAFCSNQGFEGERDSDGAIKPRGSWSHCMCGASARYTTKKGRKLVLIDQSWGDDWTQGDYYLDQPEGSFYADLDVVGHMAAAGDTFVSIDFQGFVEDRTMDTFTRM